MGKLGKYILYAFIIFLIAFTLNFFKVVSIPWLNVPFSLEAKHEGAEKVDREAKRALGE